MQFGLGVLAPHITAEFSLSRTLYGSAVSAMLLSGLVVSLATGRLVRLWGEIRLLRVLHAVAIAAFAIVALAPGWHWIVAAAVVMGVPVGLGNPVTNQLIITRVEHRRQGTATGIKQSGVQVGALFAGVALPPVAVAFGWRTAIGGLALVAVVGLALAIPLRARADSIDGVGGAGEGAGLTKLALFLAAYAALMGFGASAVFAFLPLFAYQELAMQTIRAGQLIALIGLLGAISRVLMGIIGNRVSRLEPWLAAMAAASSGGLLLLAAVPERPALLWLTIIGFGIGAAAWQAAAMLAVVREHAARSTGVVMSGFLFGMILGPLSFGWVTDRLNSYPAGWTMLAFAFAIAGLLSTVAAVHARTTVM